MKNITTLLLQEGKITVAEAAVYEQFSSKSGVKFIRDLILEINRLPTGDEFQTTLLKGQTDLLYWFENVVNKVNNLIREVR